MVLQFDSAHIDSREKQWIEGVFRDLLNERSYFANLQVLYNHSHHFTTVSSDKNICSFEFLRDLGRKAQHQRNTIKVMGSIHSNYHSSGVLLDSRNGKPIFVKDTYIRIKVEGENGFRHLLVSPPAIENRELINFYYYYSEEVLQHCEQAFYMIPPVFSATAVF
jgi:hypothetical protein